MPATADLAAVRAILAADRIWCVYALADLAPEYSMHARWHIAPAGRPGLLLVYSAFRPPVLFAHGVAGVLAGLLAEVAGEPQFYISARAEFIAVLRAAGYEISEEKKMWRMTVDADRFTPVESHAVRLGPTHARDLARLYADGVATGEAPPFFDAGMLRRGVYYGMCEDGVMVAAAGTHVLAESESVAAIGNVYTRRDRRGRGLGAQVTSAVASELLARGLQVVALNVQESSTAAAGIYARLGFWRHCEYREGIATLAVTARCERGR